MAFGMTRHLVFGDVEYPDILKRGERLVWSDVNKFESGQRAERSLLGSIH